jgi:hypothetical protein
MSSVLFDLDELETVPGATCPSPRRQRAPWVVRGGVAGLMWYGGRRHDDGARWRLWLKDAQRFTDLDEAHEVARWCGGTVEGRP